MSRIIIALLCAGVSLFSCASTPLDNKIPALTTEEPVEVIEEPPLADTNEVSAADAAEEETEPAYLDMADFDPQNPPIAIYTATKSEIQNFAEGLDTLIKKRDYEGWIKLLSQDYFEHINTPEFLDTVSQQPRLKSQNIMLKNGRDYFLNVVVTSRADLKAHDIEFLTTTRVMVFTITQRGQRIRIYILDKTPSGWEIVD
jgi:hypothetical protein